jgi:hypothetical protein
MQNTIPLEARAPVGLLPTSEDGRLHIIGYHAWNDAGEAIGTVWDYVFDSQHHLRYVVVDTGSWIFGKKLPVPVGKVTVDDERLQIQVQDLPRHRAIRAPAFLQEQRGYLHRDIERELLAALYPDASFENRQPDTDEIVYHQYPTFQPSPRLQALDERLRAASLGQSL